MELRADERAELVLLAVGEGGGGRPAWENSSCSVDIISGCLAALEPSCWITELPKSLSSLNSMSLSTAAEECPDTFCLAFSSFTNLLVCVE